MKGWFPPQHKPFNDDFWFPRIPWVAPIHSPITEFGSKAACSSRNKDLGPTESNSSRKNQPNVPFCQHRWFLFFLNQQWLQHAPEQHLRILWVFFCTFQRALAMVCVTPIHWEGTEVMYGSKPTPPVQSKIAGSDGCPSPYECINFHPCRINPSCYKLIYKPWNKPH